MPPICFSSASFMVIIPWLVVNTIIPNPGAGSNLLSSDSY